MSSKEYEEICSRLYDYFVLVEERDNIAATDIVDTLNEFANSSHLRFEKMSLNRFSFGQLTLHRKDAKEKTLKFNDLTEDERSHVNRLIKALVDVGVYHHGSLANAYKEPQYKETHIQGFATLYKVVEKETNKMVLRKHFRRDVQEYQVAPYANVLGREIELMQSVLGNDHFLQYIGNAQVGLDVFLYFEQWCPKTLAQWLQDPVGDLKLVYDWMRSLVEAVEYVHEIHGDNMVCDLDPSNILITEDNKIVLSNINDARHRLPHLRNKYVDSDKYCAPELLDGRINIDADVYALGVIFGEILSAKKIDVPQDIIAMQSMKYPRKLRSYVVGAN